MVEHNIIDVKKQKRLNEARKAGVPRKKWGPYLSERQWGTVREDYGNDGNSRNYFTHNQSRSGTDQWSEDGLGELKEKICPILSILRYTKSTPVSG